MVSKLSLPCLAALLLAVGAALGEDAPVNAPLGGDAATALKAGELRKLYGEQEKLIEFVNARGHNIKIDVFADGRLFGNNTSLIGSAAVGAGNSNGKWRVDEAKNTVCHEWGNKFWTSGCYFVRPAGPNAYEWVGSSGGAGTRFTVSPR